MAVRWVCPSCGGGVNGPQRPRMDDVRRYCLRCSAKTGRLVQRTAPSLERRREEAAARSATKARRKADAERARWLVTLKDANGVERDLDVKTELRTALTAMGYFNGWAYGHKPTISDINIKIRRGDKGHHTGRAILGGFDVWFTFGKASYEEGLWLIYHEAAHMADGPLDRDKRGRRVGVHGTAFNRLLADALQKRWPWIVYGALSNRQRGGCYETGRRIIEQMEQRTREANDVC